MTIRAGGRVALTAATGLLVCVMGVSWTSTVLTAAEQKKPAQTEVAGAGMPSELPASVANANARMGSEITDDAARAMTARANALLASDRAAQGQGAVTTIQVAETDQLNEVDKTLQEATPSSQTTVAVAPTRTAAAAAAKPAPSETSTWDQTSLIGKIFIAFGALLTIASAARMFMA